MLLVETLDAYLYMVRLTPVLAEATEPGIADIAAKAALGDSAAIGDLYTRYALSLAKIAMPYVGADGAQDVVQDLFLKFSTKKFASFAPKFHDEGRSVFAVLATAVKRAALNAQRSAKRMRSTDDIEAGAGADPGTLAGADPGTVVKTGHTEPLAPEDSAKVRTAFARALDNMKDKEREFIETLFGQPDDLKDITRFFADTKKTDTTLGDIAKKFWPDKAQPSVTGLRVRERFLKQFCKDKELLKLLPGGHLSLRDKRLKPVCAKYEGIDPVLVFAIGLGLVEDAAAPSRDKAYAQVIRWVGHNV